MNKLNKSLVFILIIFHSVGLIGMVYFNTSDFVKLSWLNILISSVVALISYQKKLLKFFPAFLLVVFFSFFIEVLGVKTSIVFGNYNYGNVLGCKFLSVPVLIGFLWLTLSLGAKSVVMRLPMLPNQLVFILSALLMVGIDYLIEPIAVKFGYWNWHGGVIPIYNYICWFVFAYVNQLFLKKVNYKNVVVEILFLINVIFFMLLNYLL